MKKIIVAMVFAWGALTTVSLATPAGAVDVFGACTGNSSSSVCKSKSDKADNLVKNVVNLLIYLTGTIAVIMIIIGGIRYTTSNGDSSGITGAKNTILYAVIGLVVAVMAYTIVNFVLTNVTATSETPPRRSVADGMN